MITEIRKDRLMPDAVREQLQKILASSTFARSERMRRFLEFTVEQRLRGQAASIKEYSIALNAYDKPPDFDPRLDPIIRVEANRLRSKLREYYEVEGQRDAILITLPKRSYKPQFRSVVGLVLRAQRNGAASEAQRLYQRGRYYWNKRSPKALMRAIECFREATQKQPGFVLALAGLGDCYASLAWLETLAPGDAWPKAREAAEAALRESPRLPQALTTLACVRALYDWDWEGAETAFQTAISASDRYATTHHWYAIFCLAPQGRLDEALSALTQARELDPASAIISCHFGRVLYYRRRYREAIEQLHESIKLDPTLHLAYWHLGLVYAGLDQLNDSRAAFAKAQELSDDPLTLAGMGYIYALRGDSDKVAEAESRLRQLAQDRYVSPAGFSMIETAAGRIERAFEYLNKAISERAPRVVHLKVEPMFDVLKTDPRFLSILAGLNLPD